MMLDWAWIWDSKSTVIVFTKKLLSVPLGQMKRKFISPSLFIPSCVHEMLDYIKIRMIFVLSFDMITELI